jgi:putative Mg2+ transporter-C (MgtC) family protein
MIALGAAGFTLASMYGFPGADGSRVASGVVAGVGFLGAGVIFRGGQGIGGVAGLTTAASIWVTAGLGLAAGCGLYALAVMIALLATIVLRLPHIRD